MKFAIHTNDGFSKHWIAYCEKKSIPYKVVNCYDNDIIQQIEDCDVLMWHHHHANYRDKLFAKQLLFSMQQSGKKVFPDFNTGWHFDDKVGQKYLLESINAPLVPSFVFYNKEDALKWVDSTTFPKVFKLRGGAGSSNVKLVRTKSKAQSLIFKAFGKGFPQYSPMDNLKDRIYHYKSGRSTLFNIMKGMIRIVYSPVFNRMYSREKGYVYFQNYIPESTFDIRVIVIGNKAFAIKRLVRDGDFRASGSGHIIYDKDEIDERCISQAFTINKKLKTQAVAFDFIHDNNNSPLIVEISYGFSVAAYFQCHGYWTDDLIWHGEKVDPPGWMVENLIK